MGVLIKNEFYKLKREWFMVFLLLLSLLPIITGGAGAIFNSSTTSLADLFFFMNNQFSMFFPMVLFILIGSLFYQEYKNKTYINWITYGFSKKMLFLSKVTVSVVIGICFAAVLFIAFLFKIGRECRTPKANIFGGIEKSISQISGATLFHVSITVLQLP